MNDKLITRRGLIASYELGSFGTRRALLLWGPPSENAHNFGGVMVAERRPTG